MVFYVHHMYTITTITANFTYRETEAGIHELTCFTSLRIFKQGLRPQNSHSLTLALHVSWLSHLHGKRPNRNSLAEAELTLLVI